MGISSEKALDMVNRKTRDNSRTPMQWNTSKNAGFTDGQPWIRINDNYKNINVEKIY